MTLHRLWGSNFKLTDFDAVEAEKWADIYNAMGIHPKLISKGIKFAEKACSQGAYAPDTAHKYLVYVHDFIASVLPSSTELAKKISDGSYRYCRYSKEIVRRIGTYEAKNTKSSSHFERLYKKAVSELSDAVIRGYTVSEADEKPQLLSCEKHEKADIEHVEKCLSAMHLPFTGVIDAPNGV